MTPERTDLLTMSGEELARWYWSHPATEMGESLAALRDAIVTAARDEAALREAAFRAIDHVREQLAIRPAVDKEVALAVMGHALNSGQGYLAATYGPRECVLSDQSVVRLNPVGEYERSAKGPYMGTTHARWPFLLNRVTDTGADFDALKSFAAERGAV